MKRNILLENDAELIKQGYTIEQIKEIREGVEKKVDVAIYMHKFFMPIQMRQIRLGLEEGLPVEVYASEDYDWFQMEEIRKGLQENLDVEKYASKDIDFEKMREIRRGLQEEIDMTPYMEYSAHVMREIRLALKAEMDILPYVDEGYDVEQLAIIRQALKKKIDIDVYISKEFRGPAIREIMLGLEAMQKVAIYAKKEYSWQQMREIRLGLKNRVNVRLYANPYFNWQQMRQIRLGLEVGLDVTSYCRYMYTAKEMSKIRNNLLQSNYDNKETYLDETEDIIIKMSADKMTAQIKILHAGKNYTVQDIINELNEVGITEGISEKYINKLLKNKGNDEYVVVAKGTKAEDGCDGWYEFFFDVTNKRQPKVLSDGSVDYQHSEWYQSVKEGEIVAIYHPAEIGHNGVTVTGEEIISRKGIEKPSLVLDGCILEEDNKTYVAARSGKVELNKDKLIIKDTLELDEVTLSTGNVDFSGNVYIRGNVGSGTVVKATGDIIINGYVETATIIAGRNIEIRLGVNAPERGYIEAGGNIAAKYFENAAVKAKKDIHANYILNSDVYSKGEIVIDGNRGTITGGTTYARLGIKTSNLGNSMRVTTHVNVGVSDEMLEDLHEKSLKIKDIKKELLILSNALDEINEKYNEFERSEMELYKKLEKSIIIYDNKLIKLMDEKAKIERIIDETKDSKIVVKGVVYEGVKIDINGSWWDAEELANVVIENKQKNVSVNKAKNK